MPQISKTLRYFIIGLVTAIIVIATPLLVIQTNNKRISRKASIGVGVTLMVVVVTLLGIAFGFSIINDSISGNVDTSVDCFYQGIKRSPLKEVATLIVPKSSIGNNGLVMAVANKLVPGEIQLFSRENTTTFFNLSSEKFTVADAAFIAVNDVSVFVAVTTKFPMKIYRQDYNLSAGVITLGAAVTFKTDVLSSPITFQVDPYNQTLLIGEHLNNGSALYIYNNVNTVILQTLAYTQSTYGQNLQVASISKGSLVVQTMNTIDQKIGTLVYIYARQGMNWIQIQGENVEDRNQDPLINVLVEDLVLLQANIEKKTGKISNWKTFVRPDVNAFFNFKAPVTTSFAKQPFDVNLITNFGSNLQVLGTGSTVFQGFNLNKKKIITYTTSFSTLLNKWYNASQIDSLDTVHSLIPPFQNNIDGNIGSIASNIVTTDKNTLIPYAPQPLTTSGIPSGINIYYMKCTNIIPQES
jgi:hypothetical protein